MRKTMMVVAGLLACAVSTAEAGFLAFTNSPSNNSSNWGAAVTGLGGSINTNVNFNSHPTGTLNGSFYTGSDGVTLTPNGDVNTVLFGAGPGQNNNFSQPTSTGEGLHSPSNYLFDGDGISSLTISFDTAVFGAGLFVIDYFNPFGTNPLVIEAYTGVNGTGTLLGTANSSAFNFQRNYSYFMGVASTDGDIRSIVFRDLSTETGDTIGIDDIRFAVNDGNVSAVPVPPAAILAVVGACSFGGAGWVRRRFARNPATA